MSLDSRFDWHFDWRFDSHSFDLCPLLQLFVVVAANDGDGGVVALVVALTQLCFGGGVEIVTTVSR